MDTREATSFVNIGSQSAGSLPYTLSCSNVVARSMQHALALRSTHGTRLAEATYRMQRVTSAPDPSAAHR